jgi:hypothetical protein
MGISPASIAAKDLTMARRSISERIAQLDAQKKALQARAGKQERANDTRRKVLLGALVLHRLENAGDAEFSKRLGDWLRRELPGFLSRESDRTLFADLLGVSGPATPPETTDASIQQVPVSAENKAASAPLNFGQAPISSTAEKPAQQRGKTMEEIMRFSEEA